jgi:hypothetical protein
MVTGQELTNQQLDPLCSSALQQDFPGLTAAFDVHAMQAALHTTLFDQNHPKTNIENCELEQATYIPGDCCVLRYLLTLQDTATGQRREALVSGRLFPDQQSCAEYTDIRLMPLVARTAGREELARFDSPIGMIAPLHMAVHAFPLDAELPTLIGATDRQLLTTILQETLSAAMQQPFLIADCRAELVDYGRQHRCTLRYHLTGPAEGDNGPQHHVVYGKLTGDGTGAMAEAISAALRERIQSSSTGYSFNVPQALAWRSDLQLSLLEAIPGEPLVADALKARLRNKPGPSGSLALEDMIDACAQIAATLHTSGLQLGRRRTLDDEVAALRQGIGQVQRISPDLSAFLESSLEHVVAHALRSDPLPVCFNHGDFTHGQLLFNNTTSGLVDFDSVCQAEPALDLGQFLTYLRVASLKSKLSPSATTALLEQLSERFMGTYSLAMGWQVEDVERLQWRVSLYRAISLLRRVVRSWQKFKPGRIESALVLLEQEMAALPREERIERGE